MRLTNLALVLASILLLSAQYCPNFQQQIEEGSKCELTGAETHGATYQIKDLTNSAFHTPAEYVITLRFGPNRIPIPVVPDTGSSDLVVPLKGCTGCSGPSYDPQDKTPFKPNLVTLQYGSGGAQARVYQDSVSFSCGKPIDYIFAAIENTRDLRYSVLGLAYDVLRQDAEQSVDSFFEQYIQANNLPDQFAMTLCGQRTGSRVLLGGREEKIDILTMQWIPIVREDYYTIRPKGIHVPGDKTYIFDNQRTIVDSGTTVNYVPRNIFDGMLAAVKKVQTSVPIPSAFWEEQQTNSVHYQISLPDSDVAKFPIFELIIQGTDGQDISLKMHPQNYLKDMDAAAGNKRIFGFRPSGTTSSGDTVLGQAFMEDYYTLFDRANKRIGFAPIAPLCGPYPVNP